MIVVMLQIGFERTGRAENLQRILRGIAEVGGSDPAPDLIALPGGCDAGGRRLDAGEAVLGLSSFREAVAQQAREWGVFVAGGFHVPVDGRLEHCALLFDPDGDIVARSGGAEPDRGHPGPCEVGVAWRCGMGCLSVWDRPAGAADFEEPVDLAVASCVFGSSAGRGSRAVASMKSGAMTADGDAGGAAYVAEVYAAGSARRRRGKEAAPVSRFVGPGGVVLACAPSAEPTVVYGRTKDSRGASG